MESLVPRFCHCSLLDALDVRIGVPDYCYIQEQHNEGCKVTAGTWERYRIEDWPGTPPPHQYSEA